MLRRNMSVIMPVIRLVLLSISLSFVIAFAVDQYSLVQDSVRFLCISCLGLGG